MFSDEIVCEGVAPARFTATQATDGSLPVASCVLATVPVVSEVKCTS